MRNFFKGLLDHARYHHETRDMPAWVRRRMYRELISLIEEEHKATEMLDLPLPPRLCVVDENRVAMLRPSDRTLLISDKEMRRAREDEQRDKQRQQSRRLRETQDEPDE